MCGKVSMLYGKTDQEKLLAERQHSREIVAEVLNFGVSDRQLYQLIELLAMNIEDHVAMQRITTLVNELMPVDKTWNDIKETSAERLVASGLLMTDESCE